MQLMLLRTAIVVGAIALAAAPARADGAFTLRGVWYKEKATRVIQPMADAIFDVGEEGEADAHLLVDAITSASVASGAAGEPFDERRWEIGGGYRHLIGELKLGGSARFSYEPDYQSVFALASGEYALADKMTTIGLVAGIGHDEIGRAGPGGLGGGPSLAGDMTTALGSVSLSQVLTPNAIAAITYDLIYLEGYQENPYRTVITADGLVAERHPEERWRHAVAGTVKRFVPATSTTLIGTYRYYADTWDVTAHTPELRVIQDAGDGVDFAFRYRYHWQSAADFYLPSYPTSDSEMFPYLTDDVKLSRFTDHTLGFRVGVLGGVLGLEGRLEDARGEIVLEYIDFNTRIGNAVTAHAALTMPFEY